MSTLERAIGIAAEAHAGQTDKLGEPYILHPMRVMLSLSAPEEMIAAALHDVVEDCPDWPLTRIEAEGFGPAIIEALDALTRRSNESYERFIGRIKGVTLARRVKLADIRDNTDPRRTLALETGVRDRLMIKYKWAERELEYF